MWDILHRSMSLNPWLPLDGTVWKGVESFSSRTSLIEGSHIQSLRFVLSSGSSLYPQIPGQSQCEEEKLLNLATTESQSLPHFLFPTEIPGKLTQNQPLFLRCSYRGFMTFTRNATNILASPKRHILILSLLYCLKMYKDLGYPRKKTERVHTHTLLFPIDFSCHTTWEQGLHVFYYVTVSWPHSLCLCCLHLTVRMPVGEGWHGTRISALLLTEWYNHNFIVRDLTWLVTSTKRTHLSCSSHGRQFL